MSPDQCLQRAQLCLALAQKHRALTARRNNMHRASWLWLFMWTGMFE